MASSTISGMTCMYIFIVIFLSCDTKPSTITVQNKTDKTFTQEEIYQKLLELKKNIQTV